MYYDMMMNMGPWTLGWMVLCFLLVLLAIGFAAYLGARAARPEK